MANSPTPFTITKNRLGSSAETKSVRITDGRYDIRIVYYGDYKNDLAAHAIDRANIIMSAKPQGRYPDLALMNGRVMIKPDFGFFQISDAPKAVGLLEGAMASGEALEQFLDRYFPTG